jgi:erythromycin esterase-like protein
VIAMLRDLFEKQTEYRRQDRQHDGEGFFDAAQNARLVASAERYYRVMYYGAAESWNLRDGTSEGGEHRPHFPFDLIQPSLVKTS